MRADAVGTLEAVAAAGYSAVELVGYGNADVATVDQVLRHLEVEVIGAHISYQDLDRDFGRALADLHLLGASFLIVQQARPGDWATVDSVKRLADRFNQWGARCRDEGLTLGYHGYHPVELEFAPIGRGTGYDLMVAETDPALVKIQLDTYWLRYLGRDPVGVLEAYAGRVPSLHMKDTALDGGDVPVGSGTTPWPAVIAAARRAGVSWFIVEQEDDPDHALQDMGQSLSFLTNALATGETEEQVRLFGQQEARE
jgi:sugar phosphate isomerase/epimerase